MHCTGAQMKMWSNLLNRWTSLDSRTSFNNTSAPTAPNHNNNRPTSFHYNNNNNLAMKIRKNKHPTVCLLKMVTN